MSLGLYIHIPFCASKCPYCDFYSLAGAEELFDSYTDAVIRHINTLEPEAVDTVYFGGGTPSLFGAKRLGAILDAAAKRLNISADAEITAEINPGDIFIPDGSSSGLLNELKASGFNRISMGVQSSNDNELRMLGRRHSSRKAAEAAEAVRRSGFDNLSLDIMLAVPGQTLATLAQSVDFICGLHPDHISAYILKIEENTPFAAMRDTLETADDELQSEMYLQSVRQLGENGYAQYEISNFALPGRESRHNLKYWHCEEYIGLGPAAHSYHHGRRYFFPRDLRSYIAHPQPVDDGPGGTPEEYAMLALRLTEGLTHKGFLCRFGKALPDALLRKAAVFEKAGLTFCDADGVHLTPEGFLVSNTIIGELLETF